MEKSTNHEFLSRSYPELAASEPVARSVKKEVPGKPELSPEEMSGDDRLGIHLSRIEKILEYKNSEGRNTAVEHLKQAVVGQSVMKVYKRDGQENRKLLKEISRNLFKAEKELARQEGRGAEVSQVEEKLGELAGEERDSKLIEIYKTKIVEAQNVQWQTLEYWMDYLTSGDSNYPTWFKYLMVKAVSKLGQLDEENAVFKKRFPQTLTPFPELNQEAVGLVFTHITDHPAEEKDFGKLYAEYLVQVKRERREAISDKGEWETIAKGADPREAMARIQGYGTGWCISTNLADMERYLANGDLRIYFSEDEHGKAVVPRVCIYVENGSVKEIRGVAVDQNLEGRMLEVVGTEKGKLPGGSAYDKKVGDMKQLTTIEGKVKAGEDLQRGDLVFLYEVDAAIEGFGYQKDPRIAELREQRNPDGDMLVVFDCTPDQIARKPSEVTEDTRAYVGSLEPGIFQKLPRNLEHVYTSFPEKKIRREDVEVGGRSAEELLAELKQANVNVASYAEHMAKSEDFRRSLLENPEETDPAKYIFKKPEKLDLIRLTVADLGFNRSATTEQIYARATELGLELCPPNLGPHYRLKYQNQPMGEYIYIGMKQIADPDDDPNVFKLRRDDDGLWLYDHLAEPDDEWNPNDEFAFCLRKSEA